MRNEPLAHREAAFEPELPIVDPHHHLWDVLTNPLATWYTLPELMTDLAGGHQVLATVYAECTSHWYTEGDEQFRPVGETAWVAATNLPTGIMGAIIGYADMRRGRLSRDVLEAHIEAGQGRFAGIRHSVSWDPHPEVPNTAREVPPGTMTSPAFMEGVQLLGELDLTFDAWMYFHQLPELAALAAAAPDTVIILDHLGGPISLGPYAKNRQQMLQAWRENLREVAQHENVFLKIGGIGFPYFIPNDVAATLGDSDRLAAYWQPEVDFAIELFGPERCMFESNFPVDSYVADYVTLWNALKKLTTQYSSSERLRMYAANAASIYGISLR